MSCLARVCRKAVNESVRGFPLKADIHDAVCDIVHVLSDELLEAVREVVSINVASPLVSHPLHHDALSAKDRTISPSTEPGLLRCIYSSRHLILGTLGHLCEDSLRRWIMDVDMLGSFTRDPFSVDIQLGRSTVSRGALPAITLALCLAVCHPSS